MTCFIYGTDGSFFNAAYFKNETGFVSGSYFTCSLTPKGLLSPLRIGDLTLRRVGFSSSFFSNGLFFMLVYLGEATFSFSLTPNGFYVGLSPGEILLTSFFSAMPPFAESGTICGIGPEFRFIAAYFFYAVPILLGKAYTDFLAIISLMKGSSPELLLSSRIADIFLVFCL